MNDRLKIQADITACHRCELSSSPSITPVPGRLPEGARIMVIGEAPGVEETRRHEPFVGRSGRLLKAIMGEYGIDVLTEVAFANTVSCWPMDSDGQTHPPTIPQMAACRVHMQAQIRLVRPQHILLVGGTALKAFRPDLQLGRVHGRWFRWEGAWTMPTYHPAAALREQSLKRPLKNDVAVFAGVAVGGGLPEKAGRCSVCIDAAERQDEQGAEYCLVHWSRFEYRGRREEQRWNQAMRKAEGRIRGGDQETLWQ